MTKQEIREGSKLIANYMGLVYISSNDLQGLRKAGWYERAKNVPNMEDVVVTRFLNSRLQGAPEILQMNTNFIRYGVKNGWILNGDYYYKYICRHTDDLKYYNSLDALVPVIEKIEKQTRRSFYLSDGGCLSGYGLNTSELIDEIYSTDSEFSWAQNTFRNIVKVIDK